jgi:uncharacterized damage-inducible protein DinB
MIDLGTVRRLLAYSDWANERLLEASGPLGDEQLDRGMEIGPGSLRRTLLHIWAGEDVWLRRWMGKVETKWPSEGEKVSVGGLEERFRATWRARGEFFEGLDWGEVSAESGARRPLSAAAGGTDGTLERVQTYRDSKGSLFTATLGDMLMQGCVHSIHHRAQAVNILRRLGATAPELDYMMRIRRAV